MAQQTVSLVAREFCASALLLKDKASVVEALRLLWCALLEPEAHEQPPHQEQGISEQEEDPLRQLRLFCQMLITQQCKREVGHAEVAKTFFWSNFITVADALLSGLALHCSWNCSCDSGCAWVYPSTWVPFLELCSGGSGLAPFTLF
jgi:hypothetical protein